MKLCKYCPKKLKCTFHDDHRTINIRESASINGPLTIEWLCIHSGGEEKVKLISPDTELVEKVIRSIY